MLAGDFCNKAKTFYNCWKRWSRMGVLTRIMTGPAAEAADKKRS